MTVDAVQFPTYGGLRCLMMPFFQGDPGSVPAEYRAYYEVVAAVYVQPGAIGYLTIDESEVPPGQPHRGARARYGRALHTEAGRDRAKVYKKGGGAWGSSHIVTLDGDVRVILANSLTGSCAVWPEAWQEDTSFDGDIGYLADQYPYDQAVLMAAGEVRVIGNFTPHESLPIPSPDGRPVRRQFLRIVTGGVHGREPYFTPNPLMN